MAHFAELDENNIVKRVIVVHNNELFDNGVESEIKGIKFCQSLFGGKWIQTSYNSTFRKKYAGIGDIYIENLDAFILPKPEDYTNTEGQLVTFVLNEDTCLWEEVIV